MHEHRDLTERRLSPVAVEPNDHDVTGVVRGPAPNAIGQQLIDDVEQKSSFSRPLLYSDHGTKSGLEAGRLP